MNLLKKSKLVIALILVTIFCIQMQPAFAQVTGRKVETGDLLYKFDTVDKNNTTVVTGNTTDYISRLPEGSSEEIMARIIFLVLVIANFLAFFSFVIAGIFMVISQGHEEDLGKAKRMFQYTVIAMVICATALALTSALTKFEFF